jgi:hypothetical protein
VLTEMEGKEGTRHPREAAQLQESQWEEQCFLFSSHAASGSLQRMSQGLGFGVPLARGGHSSFTDNPTRTECNRVLTSLE